MKWRVTLRDETLPHQIVILTVFPSNKISVSCNCLATRNKNGTLTHEPLGIRSQWEPGEAIALWRGHYAEVAA